ncbi:hypothetical protein MA16_Dca011362 [Dendrobium catenatum]|uniref:Uncharacterized protein n=1 Tax=Dendrobium catenatum TaxID=906689 RepID=A0A2I0WNW9_9ASPA|nr:hypothetical protein MA16_Dca011362 [Dendrobium catenatum]
MLIKMEINLDLEEDVGFYEKTIFLQVSEEADNLENADVQETSAHEAENLKPVRLDEKFSLSVLLVMEQLGMFLLGEEQFGLVLLGDNLLGMVPLEEVLLGMVLLGETLSAAWVISWKMFRWRRSDDLLLDKPNEFGFPCPWAFGRFLYLKPSDSGIDGLDKGVDANDLNPLGLYLISGDESSIKIFMHSRLADDKNPLSSALNFM